MKYDASKLFGVNEIAEALNELNAKIESLGVAPVESAVDESSLVNIVDSLNKLEAEVVKIQGQVKPKRGKKSN